MNKPIKTQHFEIYTIPEDKYGYGHTSIRQRLDSQPAVALVENVFDVKTVLEALAPVQFSRGVRWIDDKEIRLAVGKCMARLVHGKDGVSKADWRYAAYASWGTRIGMWYVTERAGPACGLTRGTDPSIGYHAWVFDNGVWSYRMLPKYVEVEL